MSVKTRATLTSELTALFVDTAADDSLTPEVVRAKLIDIVDSCFNTSTDTNLRGLYAYDATLVYYAGAIVQYDYKWYVANTTTVAGAFNASHWDFQGYVIYSKSTTIETANVRTLNATPVTLVSAIASKSIAVVSGFLSVSFNSIAYATNTTLQLLTDTAVVDQLQFLTGLNASVSRHTQGRLTTAAVAATDTQLIVNKALQAKVLTGNPTDGNSSITITCSYIVI